MVVKQLTKIFSELTLYCHTANVQRNWVVLVEMAVEKGCSVDSKFWTSVVEVDPNRTRMTALTDIIVI